VPTTLFLRLASVALLTVGLGAQSDPAPTAPTDKGLIVTRTGPRSYNIDAPGNLGPNKPFAGRALQEIDPQNNPIDLLTQAMSLAKEDPKAAHNLFMAASLRAAFDMERVDDATARGAWAYLMSQPGPAQLKLWGSLTRKLGQADLQAVVAWARSSGPPTYHPGWMIQHGMRAINGDRAKGDNGLKSGFDPVAAWTKVCDQAARTAEDASYWATRDKQTSPESLLALLQFLENGAGQNLDKRAPSKAADGRQKMRAACAKFDPRAEDPAWDFIEAKAALHRIFEECLAAHLKQRDEEAAKPNAGK